MWTLFNTEYYTIEQILQIIDDALCHGFEFKIENGNIYYREIVW